MGPALTVATDPTSSSTPDTTSARPARQRVADYLVALGMPASATDAVVDELDRRIDPEFSEPARRAAAMIEAFDHWVASLQHRLDPPADAARVELIFALYGGEMLAKHPGALREPTALLAELQKHLDACPQGVLPTFAHQKMHRQPLGELPSVLSGDFWSGTYRWAMPANPRRANKRVAPPATDAPAGPTPGEPASPPSPPSP